MNKVHYWGLISSSSTDNQFLIVLTMTSEKRLDVTEMRMLRWMCGITRRETVRNVRVRGTTKVVEVSKKIQERRPQWYEHVMRRTNGYVVRRVMGMEVEGKRGSGRPRRK